MAALTAHCTCVRRRTALDAGSYAGVVNRDKRRSQRAKRRTLHRRLHCSLIGVNERCSLVELLLSVNISICVNFKHPKGYSSQLGQVITRDPQRALKSASSRRVLERPRAVARASRTPPRSIRVWGCVWADCASASSHSSLSVPSTETCPRAGGRDSASPRSSSVWPSARKWSRSTPRTTRRALRRAGWHACWLTD